ncbi:MAG: hypothetical protein EBT71_02205, partial [Alphaproteobacteria bacterium]|nr:hypothetical protein [Alphaproteobacteria bacterium]
MDKVIISGDRQKSHEEILFNAARAARGLEESLGLKLADSVAIFMRNDFGLFEMSLAAAALGVYSVPVNWHYTADEANYVLDNCGAKALIIHADLLPQIAAGIPDSCKVLVVETPTELCAAYQVSAEAARIPDDATGWYDWLAQFEPLEPRDVASPGAMIYTSGTTGRPKGVRRNAGTPSEMENLYATINQAFDIGPGRRTIIPAPLYHSAPNTYGVLCVVMGMDETVPVLLAAGCRHFFVAQLAEGVRGRHIISACAESDQSFDASAIYVLSGLAANAENDYVTYRLHPCLISLAQIKNWQAHCRKAGNHPAALFLDTGFNRLGLSFDDIAEMSETNGIFEGWTLDLIASHLACADTPDHPMNRAQLEAFHTMTALLPPAPRSLANTGGIFLGDAYRFDMTRPGIGLYGGMAFPDDAAARQTVARLRAPILQTRRLSAGDAIGYGASFTADHEMRIGIVGLGYGDGLPRSFGQFNPPRVRLGLGDKEAAILGRISMDSFAIDLTDASDSIGADS